MSEDVLIELMNELEFVYYKLKVFHQNYDLENRKKYLKDNEQWYKEYKKQWAIDNTILVKGYYKKYYSSHKEQKKLYATNNKDIRNARTRNRMRYDLEFRMRTNVSGAIRKRIKINIKLSKTNDSSINYLPVSIPEIINHIESLFEPWMSWDNWGKYDDHTWDDNDSSTWTWQIDHIIPQADLPYDSYDHPNLKKAWALENLRPLSAKQNVMDGVLRIRHRMKLR